MVAAVFGPRIAVRANEERRPVTLFDFDALLNDRAEIERIGGLGFWA
jgi:hypothetical protein